MAEEVKVRVGGPEDLHEIMKMALMVCDENGLSEPNIDKILYDVVPSLHQDRGIIGVIGPVGGPLEGFVLLRIGNLWYSDTSIIEEKTVFVHPDFRSAKGGRARKLCEFSKKTADELKMTLMIGILSNQRTESKIKLYNRLFGKPSGVTYTYGAKTGEWKENAANSI